ncbi:class I mannose-6-phosphate isomerase [Facklamia sp. DSM 111018]|uniref:Mannose-6-phosphate isomerase n=1 Tax=Facklamia lactis TaxID=2749967 RepID=A0ABS0LTU2_9LACT|nr:type I phosphomannose isomerase catalytic subunit [Facklamia lactis]MBG9986895.1 class I mannose-6-phosphate isomerase [Facklamia lactis]
MMEPIFLKPVLQEKIWGGSQLKEHFALEIPSDQTGEAWVISAHPNGLSTVESPKELAGMTLDQLYAEYPALFGPQRAKTFPLLVKILDAREDLSIQVHPDDAYAQQHEGVDELGKTECWYVISAVEGAKIVYGHHAQNEEEFRAYVNQGRYEELFREIPVQAGDFFDVPAGTIHAIGGGITILETQQSSDTTYRVYDFDRVDANGNYRELHLEQSVEVTLFPHQDSPYTKQALSIEKNTLFELVKNQYFEVYKLEVSGTMAHQFKPNYYLATVIEGQGQMRVAGVEYPLTLADSFILPYGSEKVEFSGDMSLIISCPREVN